MELKVLKVQVVGHLYTLIVGTWLSSWVCWLLGCCLDISNHAG